MTYGLECLRRMDSMDAWIQKDHDLDGRSHVHTKPLLCFLMSGTIDEVDDRGRVRTCGPLTLNLQPEGWNHAHRSDGDFVALSVVIKEPFLKSLGRQARVLQEPTLMDSGPGVHAAARLVRNLRIADTSGEMIFEEQLREVVRSFVPKATETLATKGKWVARAREMLHDRFKDNPTIREIAYEIGFDQDYFIRSFESHMGTTPGAYLRMIRMQHAAKLVFTSDAPLKEIAEEVGFADQAHFSRDFRRHWGASPQSLRKFLR